MARKSQFSVAVAKTPKPYVAPPAPPPVQVGQKVFVSVLPKRDIVGNGFDASPRLFATREAAQADCDYHNKSRMPESQFCVRELPICSHPEK